MQRMIERFNIPCIRISESSRDLQIRLAMVDTQYVSVAKNMLRTTEELRCSLRKIVAENKIDSEKVVHDSKPQYLSHI